MKALDTQIGGGHYKSMAIQPAEYNQRNGLKYCEANVVKYVTRHGNKGGAEDIKKAIHYLELLLELEYGQGRQCKTVSIKSRRATCARGS